METIRQRSLSITKLKKPIRLYRADGNKIKATGKMRQLQYRLVQGEASWLFEIDTTIEY